MIIFHISFRNLKLREVDGEMENRGRKEGRGEEGGDVKYLNQFLNISGLFTTKKISQKKLFVCASLIDTFKIFL